MSERRRRGAKVYRVLGSCFVLWWISWSAAADSSRYLFVWAADADKADSDFVAVLDADPGSARYGDVLTTIEVGVAAQAHHSEHRMPDGGRLFVNGFASGHSFVIDLRDPLHPSVAAHFTGVGSYSHPHSFERLPNGNVLATFQNGAGGRGTVGGLVELSPSGELVRSASASVPEFPDVRPYSLTILPGRDRVVTTTSDMWGEILTADSLQLWRLSDLALLETLQLPPGPRGDEQLLPAEPRLLSDGSAMIANTFNCGLYQIHDIASDTPRVSHIYSFFMEDPTDNLQLCALPVTFGQFWVQTVPARQGLVSLDLGDTSKPTEVGHVDLGKGMRPHWISLEPSAERIVVTGFGELLNRVMMVKVNPTTGALAVDTAFGTEGIVDFGRQVWPHGNTGPAIPHGAVFALP